MASIRKRNGKWQARVFRKGFAALAKTFINKADAITWARRLEVDMERGAFDAHTGTPTLSDLILRYLDERTPKKKNWRKETYTLEQWRQETLSAAPASDIKASQIAKWRDEQLAIGKASGTIRNSLAALSAVYQCAALDWGYEGLENPVAKIRRPPPAKSRARRVTQEEINFICASTESEFLSVLVQLAVETGMRQSELAGLLWENINLGRRTALLPDTKNGDTRTVPLSSAAVELLAQWQKRGNVSAIKGPIFGITPHAVAVAFRRAVRRARAPGIELTDIRFHDLRHEAVSRLFERGLNAMEVAAISGHRTLQMLARYTHLRAEDLALKLG